MLRKFILIAPVCLLMASCAAKSSESQTEDSVKKETDSESLEFWTADTIVESNPRLVMLMDSLYQYIRGDFHQKALDGNIRWMRNFRVQLCNYYRETRPVDSISEYVMADSILVEARNLWELVEDLSTMGMVISNDVEGTRLVFEQFNEYDKLCSICSCEEQREVLRSELSEWLKFEETFYRIFANCVDLHFWGGSIRGPIRTAGANDIKKAHIDLYKKEYVFNTQLVDDLDDIGTFLYPAKKLLINCCAQSLEEYYFPEEDNVSYQEIYEETKSLIKELPMQIDTWCECRKLWEDEMSTDWYHQAYSRNTSEILIKMAHIISSVQ